MDWNTDMAAAPKGETREVTIKDYRTGKPVERTIQVKVPILLSVGSEVIKSHWSDDRQQWAGIAENETPDGWAPWPDPIGGA